MVRGPSNSTFILSSANLFSPVILRQQLCLHLPILAICRRPGQHHPPRSSGLRKPCVLAATCCFFAVAPRCFPHCFLPLSTQHLSVACWEQRNTVSKQIPWIFEREKKNRRAGNLIKDISIACSEQWSTRVISPFRLVYIFPVNINCFPSDRTTYRFKTRTLRFPTHSYTTRARWYAFWFSRTNGSVRENKYAQVGDVVLMVWFERTHQSIARIQCVSGTLYDVHC